MKKFSELQYSERQFNEIRNKINEQKEHFNKDIKTLKKKKQILELTNKK